jgi:glycosyltransferase involved in cell wall biosynthesis
MVSSNSTSGMIYTKKKVLYLAYDGMTDPLGQSQVLSYLKGLSKHGYSFDVIGFEKPEIYEERKKDVYSFIEGFDIRWIAKKYHKSPPVFSTIFDIEVARKEVAKLCRENKYDIVHCRGYILADVAITAKKLTGAKFIFDMRGWWPDEKKESGLWNSFLFNPVYKYYKRQERKYFEESDIAISLTNIGKSTIEKLSLKSPDSISVIPTCVNFELFKPFDQNQRDKTRTALSIPKDALVMLYSGSVGANYRTDLVLKLFSHLHSLHTNSYLFFLSHAEHSIINSAIEEANIDKDYVRIQSAKYHEVSNYLVAGDIGVIMYNTGFSVIGRSPTKLGEYWASGLNVLAAKGIGDLETIMAQYPEGGVLVDNLTDDNAFKNAVLQILKQSRNKERLREYANQYFSLESGISKYLAIYKKLCSS